MPAKQRPVLLGLLLTTCGIIAMEGATAAPLPVSFQPPAIEAGPLCTIQPDITELVAKWEDWDGRSWLYEDPEAVLSDLQRLRDADALRFSELAEAGFDLLSTIEDDDFQQKVLVDRIRYGLAAGKATEVREQGLVEQLENGFMSLSARSLHALAEAYLDGKAVVPDQERGEAYLLSAAAAGSSDALLLAAQMRSEGRLAEYGLDPQSAIVVAFGAILGEVDPGICSRISRIARYYEDGEIVEQDYGLAERWLRLAAALGDPTAAWKVARYHLASEHITKDNDVLLEHLTAAAEAGIPQAQVELGEIVEAGSLMPQDLEAAERLYQAAAAGGYHVGFLRLVGLLEQQPASAGAADRLEAALRAFTAMPQAPASAFMKLAEFLIGKQGRWAAQSEVMPLLERAVDLGSPEAAMLLADYVQASPGEPDRGTDRAISLLDLAVTQGGKSEAMSRLADLYMCRVPGAPRVELAQQWRERALAAGNSTMRMAGGLDGLSGEGLAQAQSMALQGASGPVAQYMKGLRDSGYGEDVVAFWENRISQDPEAQSNLARLLLQTDSGGNDLELSISLLENAIASGSNPARIILADLLLQEMEGGEDTLQLARDLLAEAAMEGAGAALERLAGEQLNMAAEDVLARFGAAVEARGDFDAFLFAARVVGDPQQRQAYLERAEAAASCGFSDMFGLAKAFREFGEPDKAAHQLTIASQLTQGKGWQYANLAQEFMALDNFEDNALTIVGLLEQAVAHGQISSLDRLIELRSQEGSPVYDPQQLVALVEQAVTTSSPAQLLHLARRIERAEPQLRERISQAVDIEAVYRSSAEGGNPTAMRELGKLLQQRAAGPDQLRTAMDWMEKSAELGDVEAMIQLAKAYTIGIGREASLSDAEGLLTRAADLGSKEARTMLDAMTSFRTQ